MFVLKACKRIILKGSEQSWKMVSWHARTIFTKGITTNMREPLFSCHYTTANAPTYLPTTRIRISIPKLYLDIFIIKWHAKVFFFFTQKKIISLFFVNRLLSKQSKVTRNGKFIFHYITLVRAHVIYSNSRASYFNNPPKKKFKSSIFVSRIFILHTCLNLPCGLVSGITLINW